MAGFNKVLLMGNLTKDPELRYTPNGSPVCNFRLAVNRKYKQHDELKEETCFVNVVVWGKQAENCGEYLNKGRGVFVEGRLQYKAWEGEDGQQRNRLEVVGTNIQFLGTGKGTANIDRVYEDHPEQHIDDNNLPF